MAGSRKGSSQKKSAGRVEYGIGENGGAHPDESKLLFDENEYDMVVPKGDGSPVYFGTPPETLAADAVNGAETPDVVMPKDDGALAEMPDERWKTPSKKHKTVVEPESEKPEAALADVPAQPGKASRKMLAVMVSLVVLVLIVGGIIISKMLNGNGSVFGVAVTPKLLVNNNNCMNVNSTKKFGYMELTLQKYVADKLGSVFWFKQSLPSDAVLLVVDDQGRPYYQTNVRDDRKTFVFPPLADDVKTFTLHIAQASMKAKAEYAMNLHMLNTPAVYLGDFAGEKKAALQLTGAQFSSSGSTFWLASETNLVVDDDMLMDWVKLQEEANPMQAVQKPIFTRFDEFGVVLVRLDFAPVASLESALTLTASGMMNSLPINKTLGIEPLLNYLEYDEVLNLGQYDLVLEGMDYGPKTYMLVLHVEDKDAKADPENEAANRVEARLDSSISLAVPRGAIEVPGIVNTRPAGSNVRYDVTDYQPEFQEARVADISLVLRSIALKIDDVAMQIDLAKNTVSQPPTEQCKLAVEAYFASQNPEVSGYVAYADGAVMLGERVYASVLESWMDSEQIHQVTRRVAGTLDNGVFTPVLNEVVPKPE